MLIEEQASELLQRCELIVGVRLEQIRGNLRKPENRSAAIWELLVLEEASRIGKVEYEPIESGSPDILLELGDSQKIWIEVAFLYPRFWKQERQSSAVSEWVTLEANRRGISPYKLSCRFDGNQALSAGPIRYLPHLHEKKKFIKGGFITSLFRDIENNPDTGITVKHTEYSLQISYSPNANGPFLHSGGLVQESPSEVKEHALYRIIKGKAKQHNVEGVRFVCIGSDQSNALTNSTCAGRVSVNDAVNYAFSETSSISGVIVVNIKDSTELWGGFNRVADSNIYLNSNAYSPIAENEIAEIQKLNFNRWHYCFSLEKYDQKNNESWRRVGGNFSMIEKRPGVVLEIPANLVIDALAGKTDLKKEFRINDDKYLLKCIDEGWVVIGCSWKAGDLEKGEAPRVILELEPPLEPVFWPK